MVYTVRLAGGRGGRNTFEHELRRLHVVQKNSRPGHPTTCGKVETVPADDEEVAARPARPAGHDRRAPGPARRASSTSTTTGDHTGHCRTEPPRPPSTTRCPKPSPASPATPTPTTGSATTRVDKAGSVTLRHHSRLHHIGIGRTHAGTCVILLVQDLHIRVVNAATGELLRELILDPNRDYQPTGAPKGPTRNPEMNNTRTCNSQVRLSPMS